jgi:hypothetical protein
LGILGIDKVSRFTLTSLTSILFCSYWIRKCLCICTFVLNLDYVKQDKVEDCSKLVMELAPRDHFKFSSKRKYSSIPGIQTGWLMCLLAQTAQIIHGQWCHRCLHHRNLSRRRPGHCRV